MNTETALIELFDTETLWGLLVNSGYLTISKKYQEDLYEVRIPNLEVEKEFRSIVAMYAHLDNQLLNEEIVQ
jgi:hypothetical protein